MPHATSMADEASATLAQYRRDRGKESLARMHCHCILPLPLTSQKSPESHKSAPGVASHRHGRSTTGKSDDDATGWGEWTIGLRQPFYIHFSSWEFLLS